jgi:tetratricopeptide (TPR) repeat protein
VQARKAERLLEQGRDLSQARGLLERSLAAEPNGRVHLLLAEAHARAGDTQAALTHSLAAMRLYPMDARPCLKAASLLEGNGDREDGRRLLEDCLGRIERLERLYVPRPDPEAPDAHNRKARMLHEELESGARTLREALRGPKAAP